MHPHMHDNSAVPKTPYLGVQETGSSSNRYPLGYVVRITSAHTPDVDGFPRVDLVYTKTVGTWQRWLLR
jgi:hypothetical protein